MSRIFCNLLKWKERGFVQKVLSIGWNADYARVMQGPDSGIYTSLRPRDAGSSFHYDRQREEAIDYFRLTIDYCISRRERRAHRGQTKNRRQYAVGSRQSNSSRLEAQS